MGVKKILEREQLANGVQYAKFATHKQVAVKMFVAFFKNGSCPAKNDWKDLYCMPA